MKVAQVDRLRWRILFTLIVGNSGMILYAGRMEWLNGTVAAVTVTASGY